MVHVLATVIRDTLHIYTWQDIVEISILWYVTERFITWLRYDTTYRPLTTFYAYTLLTGITYYAQLYVASSLLLWSSPLVVMILIMTHHQTLQNHPLGAKTIKPPYAEHYVWVDELIRASLYGVAKQKEVPYIIEKDDTLHKMLIPAYLLNAQMHSELIKMVIDTKQDAENTFVWITKTGTIKALKAESNPEADKHQKNTSDDGLRTWQKKALRVTQETDAFVLALSPHTRLFSCIVQGKIVEGLTALHTSALIKRYLTSPLQDSSQAYKTAEKILQKDLS